MSICKKYFHIHYGLFLLVVIVLAFPVSSSFARSSYFFMPETKSKNLKPFPKWTTMISRYEKQSRVPDSQCGKTKYHPCAVKGWRRLIESLQGKPLSTQLKEVNRWGNKHPYIIDELNWGIIDFWETPYEFMSVNGDCEDYAIAKYYSLKALGVAEDKMRIFVVQDFNLGGIIHAVLGVYNNGELFILDNQAQQVRPARKIYHYKPLYSVNRDWWWAYTPRT